MSKSKHPLAGIRVRYLRVRGMGKSGANKAADQVGNTKLKGGSSSDLGEFAEPALTAFEPDLSGFADHYPDLSEFMEPNLREWPERYRPH
jgi:hypothetical protein